MNIDNYTKNWKFINDFEEITKGNINSNTCLRLTEMLFISLIEYFRLDVEDTKVIEQARFVSVNSIDDLRGRDFSTLQSFLNEIVKNENKMKIKILLEENGYHTTDIFYSRVISIISAKITLSQYTKT